MKLNYKIKFEENNIIIQRVGGQVTFDGERTVENERLVRALARQLPNYTIIE